MSRIFDLVFRIYFNIVFHNPIYYCNKAATMRTFRTISLCISLKILFGLRKNRV